MNAIQGKARSELDREWTELVTAIGRMSPLARQALAEVIDADPGEASLAIVHDLAAVAFGECCLRLNERRA